MDDQPNGETENFKIWGDGAWGLVVVCRVNIGAEPRYKTVVSDMACSAQLIVSYICGCLWRSGDLRML